MLRIHFAARLYLGIAALIGAMETRLLAATEEPSSARRPNILLMMTDDQGWGDLSYYGNPRLDTPTLDALAAESLRFNAFRVNPACAPTRASLLTGRHYHRTGVWGVHCGRDYMDVDETLISEVLRDSGYRTAMMGKWHNGKSGPYLPWNRGFEDAWFKNGLYNHDRASFDYNGVETVEREGWAREMIADLAIDYMAELRDEPFFLYLAFPTPHTPSEAPEEIVEKYRQRGCGEALAKYYAMMDHLDTCIGRILQGVDDLGLRDETLVLFLSDNGPTRGGQTQEEFEERNPMGWRGAKGGIWENGVRSPLFVRWPGVTTAGETDVPAQVMDLFPTLTEVAGARIEHLAKPLDGRSLLPTFAGDRQPELQERCLYEAQIVPSWPDRQDYKDYLPDRSLLSYEQEMLSVVRGRHKLVKLGASYDGNQYKLFDLQSDPGETTDISAEHAELTGMLREKLEAWFRPILAEPSAYSRPVLHIGWPGESNAPLWLNCCQRKSPDIETYVYTANFNRPGAFMEFAVDVMQPGRYEVGLHGTVYEGARWRIAVGTEEMAAAGFGSGDIPLGELNLPQAGRRTMRIELLEAPTDGPAMDRLFYIWFRPL